MRSFWISRLRAIGKKVKVAEVSFSEHLNVISGPSDTGKTYILQCIDYMLGAKEPPKSVPEDEGYSTLLMEIVSNGADRYSLKRSLKHGGNFMLFESSIDDIRDDSEGQILAARHNPKNPETVSSFFLGLCGLSEIVIRSSTSKTRPVSFRDVAKFAVIDENRIISDGSPVYPTGQYVTRTANLSLFDYFASGEDSSGLITTPDIKVRKASWRAKVELYDQMIRDIEIESLEEKASLTDRLARLDARVSELTVVIESNSTLIADSQWERARSWEEWHRVTSRKSVVEQLVSRFSLLDKHYTSDIERLAFVAEADHYISQIGVDLHCPICGSPFEGHNDDHESDGLTDTKSIRFAAKAEIEKLNVLRNDLESTADNLTSEMDELDFAISIANESIASIDSLLNTTLVTAQKVSKNELDLLLTERKGVATSLSMWARLEEYQTQRKMLGLEPVQTRDKEPLESTAGSSTGRRKFCDRVQSILGRWQFPNNGVVEFSQQMDLVVNGVARRSHGKGIRAILHAAFTITLMLHARDRHPGFVVLDSPLTSFRPRDEYQVDEDIQRAFFQYLSSLKDGQIIVLENKEPPDDLVKKLRYEHFSGDERVGRVGFYPPKSTDASVKPSTSSVARGAKKRMPDKRIKSGE
ncbi:MAG: hypothetical protein JWN70_574 [Planctomycetaceae bacterium]|nr:hypothetical protein [Planctomycetaceae bacterium]